MHTQHTIKNTQSDKKKHVQPYREIFTHLVSWQLIISKF